MDPKKYKEKTTDEYKKMFHKKQSTKLKKNTVKGGNRELDITELLAKDGIQKYE